jgi:hypothetical protein
LEDTHCGSGIFPNEAFECRTDKVGFSIFTYRKDHSALDPYEVGSKKYCCLKIWVDIANGSCVEVFKVPSQAPVSHCYDVLLTNHKVPRELAMSSKILSLSFF